MGCDIHLFGEQKVNGVWVPIRGEDRSATFYRTYIARHKEELESGKYPAWVRGREGDPADVLRTEIQRLEKYLAELVANGDIMDCLYGDRNYDVFAILADVRNGRGFAGSKTGEGFNPIAMPKGLPEDVSDEIKAASDDWGVDGHSHSWLTLKELLDYDWHQGTTKTGIVHEDEYKRFKEQGSPDSWAGDIGGGSVIHLSNEEMDALLAGTLTRDGKKTYVTRVDWRITYMDHAKWFYDRVIPKLQALAGDDPESVRLVFWFDN